MLSNLIKTVAPNYIFSLNKRCLVLSCIESVLLSSATIIGRQLDTNGRVSIDAFSILALLALLLVLLLFCYAANLYLGQRKLVAPKHSGNDSVRRRYITLSIAFLAACTVFWYLALFPGIYWYDAPKWLAEWGNPETPITSQYSIPYTWLFYTLATFGNDYFGNYESGLAIFSFLQALVVLYAEIRVVLFVYRRIKHPVACILPSLFYGLHPLFAILAFSTAQDTPFMAMLGLAGIHLYEMIIEPDSYWDNWKKPLLYIFVVLLFCFSRNNGLYALLLIFPFAIAYKHGYRIKLLVATALPLLIFSLYQGPLLHAVGVDTSSTIREMSSIPVQQIARTYIHETETISDEDIELIRSYFSDDALSTYDTFPSISDSLKNSLNVEQLSLDPSAFLVLYFRLGVEHPGSYVEAALMNNLGLWCPFKQYPDSRIYHPWIECVCATPNKYYPDAGLIDMHNQSILPPVFSAISYLFGWDRQNFAQIPIVGTLCRSALYFWLLVFTFGHMLYTRRYERLVFLAPFVGIVATIILAPVVIFRYVAPFAFAAPLLVSMLLEAPSVDS